MGQFEISFFSVSLAGISFVLLFDRWSEIFIQMTSSIAPAKPCYGNINYRDFTGDDIFHFLLWYRRGISVQQALTALIDEEM